MKANSKANTDGLSEPSMNQVVGQLFFPDMTTVNTWKLEFTEVIKLARTAASYF